jgi:crotonobetainyl-CoA:carnitine CoA-transferase CaiB-like acyl-CoA transferase
MTGSRHCLVPTRHYGSCKAHIFLIAPILTVEQAIAHPHLRERRTVRTIHDRIIGEFQVPGFPLRFSEFPGELDLEAPFLGEHNRRIISEYLGYSDSQIDQLERNGCAQECGSLR